MTERPPAYQRYARDELALLATLSCEEHGALDRLRDCCWEYGTIPHDMPELARRCGLSPARMRAAWRAIATFFEPHPAAPGRLRQRELETYRERLVERRKERSESGRKGAHAKWLSHQEGMAEPMAEPSPNDGPAVAVAASSLSTTGRARAEALRHVLLAAIPEKHHHAIAVLLAAKGDPVAMLETWHQQLADFAPEALGAALQECAAQGWRPGGQTLRDQCGKAQDMFARQERDRRVEIEGKRFKEELRRWREQEQEQRQPAHSGSDGPVL